MQNIKEFNYKKGRISEDRAREYLIQKGFKFIEANFEIDSFFSTKLIGSKKCISPYSFFIINNGIFDNSSSYIFYKMDIGG